MLQRGQPISIQWFFSFFFFYIPFSSNIYSSNATSFNKPQTPKKRKDVEASLFTELVDGTKIMFFPLSHEYQNSNAIQRSFFAPRLISDQTKQ